MKCIFRSLCLCRLEPLTSDAMRLSDRSQAAGGPTANPFYRKAYGIGKLSFNINRGASTLNHFSSTSNNKKMKLAFILTSFLATAATAQDEYESSKTRSLTLEEFISIAVTAVEDDFE